MNNSILRFSFAIFAFLMFGLAVNAQTKAETFAITNAQIVTVSGPTIKGTIVVRDGLIEAVGETAKIPADARLIDGTGLTIYPGLFDAYTSFGLQVRMPPTQQTQVVQTTSNSNYPDGLRPEENVFQLLKAGEAQFESNRNNGFTTVLTVSRDGVFNGKSAIINLAGNSVSEMIIRAPFAEHFTFTTVRGGAFPTALMGTIAALRQMLLDAQRLQELQKEYAKNPRGMKRPEADASLEALIPVLNGTMPIVFNANSENEIVRVLDLAQEFNLKAIIAGGQEAWKVTDRIKKQNIPVLLSLNFPKRTTAASTEADQETLELLKFRAETPKGAARLAAAGVKFAFQSGGMTNLNDFLTNASKAIENGLDRTTAIRAMTLTAAEILGVDNRLGSIEVGKIANLTIVRGDIFSKDKVFTHIFIDGKLFEQKEKPKTPTTTTTTNAAIATVGGSYNISINVPGQPLSGTLNLVQQGAVLTGDMQTQAGTSVIKDGKVTAEGFTFSSTVEFGGSTIEITVNGKISGNQISGTIESPQGAAPFTGTKIP